METENSDMVAMLESVLHESKKENIDILDESKENIDILHGIGVTEDAIISAGRLGKQHFAHNLTVKQRKRMETENSDMVAKLESVLHESKEKIERLHGIRVTEDAIVSAACLGKQHFTHNLTEQEVQEKVVYIVHEACLIMRKKFLEHEHVLDEREYILRRALVEYNELVKEKSFFSKYWEARVMNELNYLSKTLGAFVNSWKTLSSVSENIPGFLDTQTIRNEILSTFKNYHSDDFSKGLQQRSKHLELLEIRAQNIFKDHLTIGASHVAEVVSGLTGIPVPLLLCSPIEHGRWMTNLNKKLRERVIDQDHVIDAVLKAVFKSLKEFSSSPMHVSRRPLASFLFLGPSGVGKTELAKSMAKHLFSDVNRLIRIDMSEYADQQSSSLLNPSTGLSNGAQQSGLSGLAEVLRVNPYSLILFDKIEKAHSSVVEALLPIITDGELTNRRGQTVDFSKTIIIMTSNVGSSQLHLACSCFSMRSNNVDPLKFDEMHNCKLKGSGPERVLEEARRLLSHDLLQSLDDVLVFHDISHVEAVTRLMLRDIARDFADVNLLVHPSDAMLDIVSLHATEKPVQVGKAIKGWLDENVVPVLSKTLLNSDEIDEYPIIYIDTLVGTKELSFRLETSRYIAEDWSLKEWNESLRKVRATYRNERKRANQIFLLRRMNSRLVDMVGDKKSNIDMGSLSLALLAVEDWPVQDEGGSIQAVPPSCMAAANTCHTQKGAKEMVKSLRSRLQERIRGQHQAIDLIANAIMGSIDAPLDMTRNRPSQCFLFVGLTSVGKMGLVKGLSELLLGDDGKSMLIQIDLSEYAEAQSRLFSAPQGNEKGGFWILEAVKARPYSVLLFDQVEKANTSVYKTLLRILDTGLFTDNQGLVVDFRTTTIILTTDLGNKTVIARLYCRSDLDDVEEGVEQGMSHFRSELLNRMDEIILFNPLSPEQKDVARVLMAEDSHEKDSSRLLMLPCLLYYIFCKKNDPIFEKYERSGASTLMLFRISSQLKKDWDGM